MIYLKHSACHTFNTLLRSPKEPKGIHVIQANPRGGTFTAPATLFDCFFYRNVITHGINLSGFKVHFKCLSGALGGSKIIFETFR